LATAPIQPLAWEPPYASGMDLKRQKKKKRKKKEKRKREKERKKEKLTIQQSEGFMGPAPF